MTIWRI